MNVKGVGLFGLVGLVWEPQFSAVQIPGRTTQRAGILFIRLLLITFQANKRREHVAIRRRFVLFRQAINHISWNHGATSPTSRSSKHQEGTEVFGYFAKNHRRRRRHSWLNTILQTARIWSVSWNNFLRKQLLLKMKPHPKETGWLQFVAKATSSSRSSAGLPRWRRGILCLLSMSLQTRPFRRIRLKNRVGFWTFITLTLIDCDCNWFN